MSLDFINYISAEDTSYSETLVREHKSSIYICHRRW